jgi:hypothetical protein
MALGINISYNLDEFLKYKELNMMFPSNLKSYCNELGGNIYFRDTLLKETGNIIESFLNGRNPNDIIFKNNIIENLNKVNQRNYIQILENLKLLEYSKAEHFITFTTDIINRAMTDVVGVKGIELPNGQQSLTDIYINIILEFFPLQLTENGKEVKFSTIFLDLCRKYFDDFTDPLKLLDENNSYRVDNFKGFTNLLGLLFVKGLVNAKVIYMCLSKLRDLIFNTSWSQTESTNAYDGYRKILYHIIVNFENNKILQALSESDKKFLNVLSELNQDIKVQNKIKNRLGRFTIGSHEELDKKLNKLL